MKSDTRARNVFFFLYLLARTSFSELLFPLKRKKKKSVASLTDTRKQSARLSTVLKQKTVHVLLFYVAVEEKKKKREQCEHQSEVEDTVNEGSDNVNLKQR